MSQRRSVIVTGVGGRSTGQQILHALLLRGDEYRIVATDSDPFSFGLYQVDERHVVPRADHRDYIRAMLWLIERAGAHVILPGTQPEVLELVEHRDDLAAAGCALIANPAEVVRLCSNKRRLQGWLEQHSIGAPKTSTPETWKDLVKEVGYPIIGKPADQTGGSRNVAILKDEQEIETYLEEAARRREGVLLQEYVGSAEQEYTVGVLVSKTGQVIDSIVMRRKLTGLSLGDTRDIGGQHYALSTGYSQGYVIRHPAIQGICERLALALGARGPLNIQCRLVNDEIKVFEVHPRFSGTTSIRAEVGFNEPDILIKNFLDGARFGRLEYQTNVATIRAFKHVVVPLAILESVPRVAVEGCDVNVSTRSSPSEIRCPCCHGDQITDFITYKNLPAILFPVDLGAKDTLPRHDLTLSRCVDCNHIFQPSVDCRLNEYLYTHLYKYYPFGTSETFSDTYRVPFNTMFDLFYPGPVVDMTLLEIGCSSIDSMRPFSRRGFLCTGVDPSRNTNVEDTVCLIGESYENVDLDQLFDVAVLRFNLEHMTDLDLVVRKLKANLKRNGLLFVQVPSVDSFIVGGMLCFGAHEHIHYFSRRSLEALLSRFGFTPVLVYDWRQPSLIGVFSNTGSGPVSGNPGSLDGAHYASYLKSLYAASAAFSDVTAPYANICLYGAGLQLAWLLYVSKHDLAKHRIQVVDDNKLLHGRYMPYFDVPIVPMTREVLSTSDVVVLSMNSIYYEKALSKIRTLGPARARVIAYTAGTWAVI